MVLSYTNEVDQGFKTRMAWWYFKLNNVKLKIRQDPWLDFMLCWMIFDAYLTEISQSGSDRDKLDYFYQNRSDFKDRILKKWNSLSGYALTFKELSPIQDMRPNSNGMIYLNDENSLEQTFDFVYQIRCNLFHGAKDMKNDRDAELVSRGAQFLRFCIDRWMKGD
ncbi:MAG: hypothetical protein Q8P86_03750 [bacterium]|nr:hypothetical protein [bacterium]